MLDAALHPAAAQLPRGCDRLAGWAVLCCRRRRRLARLAPPPGLPPCLCRAQEFKALQQHIDELTEEKFMLQVRCPLHFPPLPSCGVCLLRARQQVPPPGKLAQQSEPA